MLILEEEAANSSYAYHRQDSWAGVLELKILVLELVAIDRLATSAVVVGEVAALAHEVWNDTMERAVLEAEALFACAQCTEVLSGLGYHIGVELHDDPTEGLTISSDVEKASGIGHGFCYLLC